MYNFRAFELLSIGLKSINLEDENEISTYMNFSKKRKMIKAKLRSLIGQAEKIQNTVQNYKENEVLNLIMRLNKAFKRNLAHEFDENKGSEILQQTKDKEKLNLIKYFYLSEQSNWSITYINFILAEKIIQSLTCANDFYSIKYSYLNKIDLNANRKLRSTIKKFLTEEIKELLFNVILLSKNSDSVSLAASNAITLLNESGFSFANKDLSRIKIPNADLSWGLFIHTNFESSYLYGVNFSQSQIFDSNFRNCNMINVDFGSILISSYKEKIETAKFSPCGRYLAIVIRDKTFLYDAKTFQNITQLIETKAKTNLLLFSDNGNYLASSMKSNEKTFTILWDISTQSQITTFWNTVSSCCCFSPCNSYICLVYKFSDTNNIVKIYNIKTKIIVKEIRYEFPDVDFVSFLSSGKHLIIKSETTLRIWELSTCFRIAKTYCRGGKVSVSFNRKYIAFFNARSKIVLCSTENLEPLISFYDNYNFILSDCGKYIALRTRDDFVKIFNLSKGKEISEMFSVNVLDFYPNEKYVLTNNYHSAYQKLIKMPINIKIINKEIWREHIRDACFSDDSQLWAVLSAEGWISIFFTENQKLLNKFRVCGCSDEGLAWSNNILASSYCKNKSIKFWNVYDGYLFKEVHGRCFCPKSMFSPDGKKIITSNRKTKMEILDIDSNQIIYRFKSDQKISTKWYWSQSENFIISINNRKIKIWVVENQELFAEFGWYCRYDFLVSKSFCGKFLIFDNDDRKKIYVWDLGDLTKIENTKKILYKCSLDSFVWSSDSKIFIASNHGTIIIWDYDTGNVVNKIKFYDWLIRPINVSKHGHFISYGKRFETIMVWNLDLLKYYQKKKNLSKN